MTDEQDIRAFMRLDDSLKFKVIEDCKEAGASEEFTKELERWAWLSSEKFKDAVFDELWDEYRSKE